MSTQSNLEEIKRSLSHLAQTGLYDTDKYTRSLLHQTSQLEYFYCHLVKEGGCAKTYYHVPNKPKIHQLAYFNIGRGFPKELMDGHWCYVLKDLGYKMLIVPCTSIKEDSSPPNPAFEKDILMRDGEKIMQCRMQLSDLRTVDLQRLDQRKSFYQVITKRQEIQEFLKQKLFD